MSKNTSLNVVRASVDASSDITKTQPIEALIVNDEETGRLKKENTQLRAIRRTLESNIKSRFNEIAQLTRMLQHADNVSNQLRSSKHDAEGVAQQKVQQIQNSMLEAEQALQLLAQRSAVNAREVFSTKAAAVQTRGMMGLLSKRQRKEANLYSLATKISLIKMSGLFDSEWYQKKYVGPHDRGIDPAEHYLLHGAAAGNNPGPLFDAAAYLQDNRDVAESGQNPLLHYVFNGCSEGRVIKIVKE